MNKLTVKQARAKSKEIEKRLVLENGRAFKRAAAAKAKLRQRCPHVWKEWTYYGGDHGGYTCSICGKKR